MSSGFFITGTDTDVGKTAIACGLVHRMTGKGERVAVMKPVASGCAPGHTGLCNDDALALIAASRIDWDYGLVNPYAFEPAVAPHIAAAAVGVTIRRDVISAAFAQLAGQADTVIVEGVGGFRVPLGDDFDTADVAQDFGLPVILVVGLRLGCLNHALLSAEAIAKRGLVFAGWVGNGLDAGMAVADENVAALEARLPGPCLGIVPQLATADAASVAVHLRLPFE